MELCMSLPPLPFPFNFLASRQQAPVQGYAIRLLSQTPNVDTGFAGVQVALCAWSEIGVGFGQEFGRRGPCWREVRGPKDPRHSREGGNPEREPAGVKLGN